jgi:hypothetical protein
MSSILCAHMLRPSPLSYKRPKVFIEVTHCVYFSFFTMALAKNTSYEVTYDVLLFILLLFSRF